MTTESPGIRKRRKEEAKHRKRQRIEEAGGVRPRAPHKEESSDQAHKQRPGDTRPFDRPKKKSLSSSSGHRFGRVMESVPCRNKPRFSTLSIALPGSVLANCQTKELRTLLVGQIARAATIYHVDEIVVFDDKLGNDKQHHNSWNQDGWRRNREHDHRRNTENADNNGGEHMEEQAEQRKPRSSHQELMARLLQYCECPQYLRRQFFPMHPDLQFAGLLAPVDAPHHVRGEDHCKYREGVVLNKCKDELSLVNCGIRNRPVEIDRKLTPGIRCTVEIDRKAYGRPGHIRGTVVSPSAPREDNGSYWGYVTRLASSIEEVFSGCPFDSGYDLKIGTSERGDRTVEDKNFQLPKYEHSLIVFGGVAGIEECVDADESIKLPGSESRKLFDIWLNSCPFQGSRTIRTEEAVLISLATLSAPLSASARRKEVAEQEEIPEAEFSDSSVSDESSGESDSGRDD